MKGKADGEEGNKGLEATKQEYMSRMQIREPWPRDSHGEKGITPVKGDEAAKPWGKASHSPLHSHIGWKAPEHWEPSFK